MWPWEHLAFGYVLYSGAVRLGGRSVPGDAEILLLVLATQLPDLIDKPLSWGLNVLPSGLSLAHSLLFALPLVVLVLGTARWRGRISVGLAFAAGYGTHLAGDALYPYLVGRPLLPTFLLWPLYYREAGVTNAVGQVVDLAATFLRFLGTPRGRLYILFEVALLLAFVVLWVADGRPGLVGRRRRQAEDAPIDE
jgi:membrane-bound metal-dependent hydrolase YbcI (DUF457 family)